MLNSLEKYKIHTASTSQKRDTVSVYTILENCLYNCTTFKPAISKVSPYCAISWTLLTCLIYPTAFVGFSESEYIFAEEDGTGSVMIEGTPGVEVRVMGGRLAICIQII